MRVYVDHQRGQQDESPDQDLQEAVDVHVIEAVVQHAEHEQADDGVADPAAPAEQARAADDDSSNRIQKISVELVLLRRTEMGDPEHAGNA